jgi:hypothetical protein
MFLFSRINAKTFFGQLALACDDAALQIPWPCQALLWRDYSAQVGKPRHPRQIVAISYCKALGENHRIKICFLI